MTRRLRLLAAALLLVALAAVRTPPVAAVPAIGPLRIVLLVDSSSAIAPMLNSFRAGLMAFLDGLPGTPETIAPEVTMISTGGQLRVRVPVTTDREKLRKAAAGFASDGGGNSFLDTMLEADKRFLKSAPERRPVFVIVMTDNSAFRGEPRIDDYNKFARDFISRGGRAHALVIRGMNSGINTDIVMNLTSGTGGYYDAMAVANGLPERMKYVAAMVAADVQ